MNKIDWKKPLRLRCRPHEKAHFVGLTSTGNPLIEHPPGQWTAVDDWGFVEGSQLVENVPKEYVGFACIWRWASIEMNLQISVWPTEKARDEWVNTNGVVALKIFTIREEL